VTDVLDVHGVLKFAPAGVLLRSVGATSVVEGPGSAAGSFGFPNGISVHDGRVYVADSNNGRIQVFNEDLEFEGMTVTGGLPRGIDFLPARTSSPNEYVLIDALSNDATVRSADDDRIVQFADSGDSRLAYPNGVSVMESSGRIYIADTAAARVQVWGWEPTAGVLGIQELSWPLMVFLGLLPFLPLLLLRRVRVLATPDFLRALIDAGRADLLGRRSLRWLVPASDYGALVDEHPQLAAWTRPTHHSQQDADALSRESGLADAQAATLIAARRADVLATDQDELRERASARGMQTIRSQEFMDRFSPREAPDVAEDGPVG
ncbi:MAG: NHL repeat-containing protein, partial [Coriobacteriia bacterium]